jgi:peptide deformylase
MIITDQDFLHSKCEDATEDEIGSIVEQLEAELKHSEYLGRPGIGLAAIQIGIKKNIAIIRMNNYYSLDLVNAKINKTYNQMVFNNEGCLSIPGQLFDTKRFQEIEVVNSIFPNNFIATGTFAICIQHELDHLKGVLASDIALPRKQDLPKLAPNEKCFCGSGIKFKKCHARN